MATLHTTPRTIMNDSDLAVGGVRYARSSRFGLALPATDATVRASCKREPATTRAEADLFFRARTPASAATARVAAAPAAGEKRNTVGRALEQAGHVEAGSRPKSAARPPEGPAPRKSWGRGAGAVSACGAVLDNIGDDCFAHPSAPTPANCTAAGCGARPGSSTATGSAEPARGAAARIA